MKKLIFMFVLLCASSGAMAQTDAIYKWVDASGNVHYGDRPNGAENAPIEVIEIASSRTSPARVQQEIDAVAERGEELNEARELEAKARQEAANAQAEKEALQQQCAGYRSRLQKFNTARRLYRTDDNGEREYLDEEQMQQTRSDLEENIRESCSGT